MGLDDRRLSDHLHCTRAPLCLRRRLRATAGSTQAPRTAVGSGRRNGVTLNQRWSVARLDRRAVPRVEYRRTAPALLELEGHRCAVRDLGCGGLRVEPAPAGRVWEDNQQVTGTLQLRSGERFAIGARIGRVDRAGLALFPDGTAWPSSAALEPERT